MGLKTRFGRQETRVRNRLTQGKGDTVASATTIALGDKGNLFPISGTTTISHIATTGWTAGSQVTLQFTGALTLTHNASSPATGYAAVKLQGAGDLVTAAGDRLTIAYDGTDWVEVSRAIVAGISATAIAPDSIGTSELADGAVAMANLADLAGLSLIGRAGSTTGVPAAITGTDGGVARVSGTTLGFGAIAAAGITDAILTGAKAATVADVNVVGGIPVLFRTLVASGANGDVDITSTHKVRVVNAWVVLKGAGTAGCTLTLKNGANAISDAVDVSGGGDRDRFDVGEIDDAQHEVAAAGTIRWSKASTGADFPGAECYVLAVRVA